MAGLQPSTLSKTISIPSQSSSPAPAQLGTSVSGDNNTQRRSGGSGSFGAGAATRSSASSSAPRNKQPPRTQGGKQSRRFRIADEEAAAESVSLLCVSTEVSSLAI